jgi:hypothetical protein
MTLDQKQIISVQARVMTMKEIFQIDKPLSIAEKFPSRFCRIGELFHVSLPSM